MGGAMREFVASILVALGFSCCGAHADVVYDWKTLSATLNGVPTTLAASGEITLTDAGFGQGFGQVTTTLLAPGGPRDQTIDGVASASFEMFGGPDYTLGAVVNFLATVSGQRLDVSPNGNQAFYGGFFVDIDDTDAYYAVSGGGGILTVGYGTDNQASPCYGPQQPGQSHCVVTGIFELVPEPGTFSISLAALGMLMLIGALNTKPKWAEPGRGLAVGADPEIHPEIATRLV
jgi:hypothetical protein